MTLLTDDLHQSVQAMWGVCVRACVGVYVRAGVRVRRAMFGLWCGVGVIVRASIVHAYVRVYICVWSVGWAGVCLWCDEVLQ